MPAEVELLEVDVRKAWPGFALQVGASIPLVGVTGLFGASGSGKTTLLRLIAGLDVPDTGHVRAGSTTWFDRAAATNLAPHRRPVAYVFQDARLFAHLSVRGNLEFAARRAAAADPGPDFDEVVPAFGLQPLLARRVQRLSGGERQRVAFARALLTRPRILLLDEPLAGLDAGSKRDIIPYIESLHARFRLPVLYVSHAVDEIVRLAERVVVLEGGRMMQQGATAEVMNAQAIRDSSGEHGATVLDARVVRQLPDLHLTEVAVCGQPMFVPALPRAAGSVRLYVRAGDVALAAQRPERLSIRNVLKGRLHDLRTPADSAFATAVVDIGGTMLHARLTRQAVIELELAAGMEVYALLKTASFDRHAPPA